MPRLKRLSIKQRKFVTKLVKTGNATEAALDAYSTKKRDVAQAIGSQNLQKPMVQDALEEALKKNEITLDGVTGNVSNIANETDIRPSADTVLKANVELLKLLKAYPERTTKHLSYSIKQDLTEKSFDELIVLHREKSKELEDILNN